MRNTNRCEDALSQAHLEHLLLETNTMRKINEFSRPTISQQSFHLDRSVLFRLSNNRRKKLPEKNERIKLQSVFLGLSFNSDLVNICVIQVILQQSDEASGRLQDNSPPTEEDSGAGRE